MAESAQGNIEVIARSETTKQSVLDRHATLAMTVRCADPTKGKSKLGDPESMPEAGKQVQDD